MAEHILKAILSQGTSALGQFVRWWLLALACVGGAVGVMVAHDHGIGDAIGAGIVITIPLAIPVAVVVAIIGVAVKW